MVLDPLQPRSHARTPKHMPITSPIDTYLQKVDQPQRQELERVRKLIVQTAPDAEECITYGMPGFKYMGKYLIAFAAFKDHMSIFPGTEVVEALTPKLGHHKLSRGTIQFTLDKPLSEAIIKEAVRIRLNNIAGN